MSVHPIPTRKRSIISAPSRRPRIYILALLASLAAVLLWSCNNRPTEPDAEIDLAPFKKMAQASPCSDIRNRLFLIDGKLVFWEGAGHCSDAAFGQILYSRTLDHVLCNSHDSIAGPVKTYSDDQYQEMCDTIFSNLDRPDLGLGPQHRVEPIPF